MLLALDVSMVIDVGVPYTTVTFLLPTTGARSCGYAVATMVAGPGMRPVTSPVELSRTSFELSVNHTALLDTSAVVLSAKVAVATICRVAPRATVGDGEVTAIDEGFLTVTPAVAVNGEPLAAASDAVIVAVPARLKRTTPPGCADTKLAAELVQSTTPVRSAVVGALP